MTDNPTHEVHDWCPPRSELGEGSWPLLTGEITGDSNRAVVEAVSRETARMLDHLPAGANIMVTFAVDRNVRGGTVYAYGWTQDRSVRLDGPVNEFRDGARALADHLSLRLLDAQLEDPEPGDEEIR